MKTAALILDPNETLPVAAQSVAPMRILIVALNYAPEIVGCGKYTSELAEELVRRGHRVEVITSPPYYPDWKIASGYSGAAWRREELAGVVIHRTPLYVPPRPTGSKRLAHLASFGLAALPTAVGVALRLRPQIVFTVAPTLAACFAGLAAARACGARSWLHVQDFEVDAAFQLGVLKAPAVRGAALSIERSLLRAFDKVSSISPAMVDMLERKGVRGNQTIEMRNWVDVDAIEARPSSDTPLRKELRIPPEQIVALYSGNMAGKQGLEMLPRVAADLAAAGVPVTLLLCGGGPARAGLEQSCRGLDNVRFLPLQPLTRLSELLATADIHLLPQRPEAADLVLPSKLTGMLASGRPVVAMAAEGTGLELETRGCGIAVDATSDAMTRAIIDLASAPDRRGAYGHAARERAKSRWKKSAIISAFEQAASALASR